MRTPLFVFRWRRRLRGWAVVLFPLAGALLLIGFLLAMLSAEPGQDGRPAIAEAPQPPTASAKIEDRTDAAIIAASRSISGGDLSHLPPVELPPPLFSIDGTMFRRGNDVIRLDGIEGPGTEAVCLDDRGRRWSCGLQARAALHNLVANRALRCQPVRAIGPEEFSADCAILAKDGAIAGNLAQLLVSDGWARPSGAGSGALAGERDAAKGRGAGLWRGGWAFAHTSNETQGSVASDKPAMANSGIGR